MKKALMLSTYGDFFWAFEKDNIEILKKMGFKIYVAANLSVK